MQELSLAKECVIKKLDLLTNSTIVDDDEVKVHILEKQQSSKYKLKLFSLYKSLKKKNMRIMKRKTAEITITQTLLFDYCIIYPVHFLPTLVFHDNLFIIPSGHFSITR